MNPAVAAAFLDRLEQDLAPLRRRNALALWRLTTTGEADAAQDVASSEREIAELFADRAAWSSVRGWLERTDPDTLLGRRLRLYRDAALPRQIPRAMQEELIEREVALEHTYGTFRATLDGEEVADNHLDQGLREERDPSRRRAAWEATRDVGRAVAEDVRRVAHLRNAQARHLGFRDYYALAMDVSELDEGRMIALFDRLEQRSQVRFAAIKEQLDRELATRFRVPTTDLRPWHYPDRFGQQLPSSEPGGLDRLFTAPRIEQLARTFYAGIGLPIDRLWEASDLYPRPGKDQHAFCLPVDPPGDVRVLCNIADDPRWMATVLHEFGHALYDAHLPGDLPQLTRQAAHPLVTEAVAMLFGRLVSDPHWLVQVAGAVDEDAERAERTLRANQVVFLRWALVVVRFEQQMYADPDADLDAAWWHLVRQLQDLHPPAARREPDWAAKVHVACYPAYYQNYVLGEVVASQLLWGLARALGDDPTRPLALAGRPEVGEYLRGLFRLGATLPWERTLREVTGTPLQADHYLRQFMGDAS